MPGYVLLGTFVFADAAFIRGASIFQAVKQDKNLLVW
jgi:hypothetical protein